MDGSGDQHQLLVIPFQLLEGVFAEIAGVSLVAVDEKDGASDLIAVLQDGMIQE